MLVEVKNNLVVAFRHWARLHEPSLTFKPFPGRAANEALRISQGRSAKAQQGQLDGGH